MLGVDFGGGGGSVQQRRQLCSCWDAPAICLPDTYVYTHALQSPTQCGHTNMADGTPTEM